MQLSQSPFIRPVVRGELTCLEIRHPRFRADLLLQGAQLLHFAPTGQSNWLWLSEQATYRRGQSVRGGIPVCWPWFGNAALNPPAVQNHITQPQQARAHGFARARDWTLSHLYEACDRIELTLKLTDTRDAHWQQPLTATIRFVFRAERLSVHLTTHNHGQQTVYFSQALHTYFPTSDIHQVRVEGLAGATFVDTLDAWREKTETGSVRFQAETDRIYYPSGSLTLITPERRLSLQAWGSHSAVVWNPWIRKSLTLSQFAADAWQRMFCVETANAAADAVALAAGDSHELSVSFSC